MSAHTSYRCHFLALPVFRILERVLDACGASRIRQRLLIHCSYDLAGGRNVGTSATGRTGQANVISGRSIGWWFAQGAVFLAMVTSAVFGVLSCLAPSAFLSIVGVRTGSVNAGAEIFAAYTGARELAIAFTLVVLLLAHASRGLAAVMLLTAVANGFDSVHALISQRWVQAPGALVLAIIYLAAALWLLSHPARREDG